MPLYAGQEKLNKKIDKVEGIQLRMEQKLTRNIEALHDRDDAHDKKLKDYGKRIVNLEEPTL